MASGTPDFKEELEHARQDERTEREERRGLEARAGVLLAAGAAIVGLVANAARDVNVTGAERNALLTLILVGSIVMVVALGLVARALSLGMTRGGHSVDGPLRVHDEKDVLDQRAYVKEIRTNNETMIRWLRPATWIFAASVACFLATLIWASYASAPPPKTNVTVVVEGQPGPAGPRGPRGRQGPRGRSDPSRRW